MAGCHSVHASSMTTRLTALDATFLELEQADESAHMHIGGIMVFDPVPGGGAPAREQYCEQLAERLQVLPRYGQRLSAPHTGGLSFPEWTDVPGFDAGRHVTRAALPAPPPPRAAGPPGSGPPSRPPPGAATCGVGPAPRRGGSASWESGARASS